MTARKSRRTDTEAPKPRFTAHKVICTASVYDGDKHFITVATFEGAERLADLLNHAVAVAGAGGGISLTPGRTNEQIAYAVAKAMGWRLGEKLEGR